jgi:uncharacterized protein
MRSLLFKWTAHFLLKFMTMLIFGFGFRAQEAVAFDVPALSGPVIDQAGFVSSSDEGRLNTVIRRFNDLGQAQIQVLVLNTIDGLPIEQVSIQIVDQWKLGDAKKDNGILLLVAAKERKIRIEVGQGLEGILPDIKAGRIIRSVISPAFKAGRTSDGIVAAVESIILEVAPESNVAEIQSHGSGSRSKNKFKLLGGDVLIFLIFLILMILQVIARAFGFRSHRFGLGGGFGGGFGGGSGGGWSGGGGGFSGGGASGDW